MGQNKTNTNMNDDMPQTGMQDDTTQQKGEKGGTPARGNMPTREEYPEDDPMADMDND
jgi:hypothetical protein